MASPTAATEWTVRRQPRSQNRVRYWLLRHTWAYAAGFVTVVAGSFLVMLPPVVLRQAIDEIAAGTTRARLVGFAAIILVLAVLDSVTRFASRLIVSGTSRRIEYALRDDIATHLMELDRRFYLRSHTGDLMARCTNDLEWMRNMLGPTLMDIARTAVMLAIGLGFLFTINVKLALISVAYLPLVGAVVIYVETAMEGKFRAVQDQFGVLTNRAQENISGIRAIKAYAQEEAEIASFGRDNRELMRRALAYAYFSSAFLPAMILVIGSGTVLVVWFGGHDVVADRITIGQFVQFNAILALLGAQLAALGFIVTSWQQGTASMGRISELLNAIPDISDPVSPTPLERIRGEVEFHDVSFGYDDRPVLEHLNLRIPAGATVAIVGGTGVGKTTLVELLVRMHDPTEGRVTIDGVDVRDLPLQQLRQAVGFVPQESFLFSETLRANISFGRPDPPEQELQRAIEIAQLSNDLDQLPDGLGTVIGERGVTLSGGQKQRAALARALLKDPPILVLDDALSHVDVHTEEKILRGLREFMRDRTTIVIAHRTSTLAQADRIVVLADNTIAEQGTHVELIARGGIYARFYDHQLLKEQLERAVEVDGSAGPDGPDGSAGPDGPDGPDGGAPQ